MEVERLTAVLEASGLAGFQRSMEMADHVTGHTKDKLGALAEVSRISTEALQKVRMTASQAVESEAAANRIKGAVGSIPRGAREATERLEQVKLGAAQAAETAAAADQIDRKLKDVTGNANEARRAMESVRLAGLGAGGARDGRGPVRTTGAGVGPFGSGFGRLGVLGTAIGAGVLAGPAAAPAAVGLLAAVPGFAFAGAGALGTLMLAFDGVGKAIGGDKKAFDDLTKSQQAFVLQVRSLDGWLDKLKETAANTAFPGLTKGLHEALSPQTVGAISTAVSEFGHAIGSAGEMWGRYFGSAKFLQSFGPLMKSGAQDFQTLSATALQLFDSLAVLGRAAAPLTTWLTQQTAVGAKWIDTWLRAKEATGGLAGAMTEARSSLTLVAKLFESLWHVVLALGKALYPISKIAVKDLTGGLNGLAAVITRNQAQIRAFVGGALHALVATIRDLSNLVRTLSPLLHTVFSVINQVAHAMGGWNHVLELLIALKFASVLNGWAVQLAKVAGGAGFKGAEKASGGLLANLIRLGKLGPIKIPFTLGGLGLGVALADIGAILAAKGDQGPGPPGDRLLGKSPGQGTPLLDALSHSDATFKGAPDILREYKAYRKQRISAGTMEAYLRSHFKELQRIGVDVSPADLERSTTLATTVQNAAKTGGGGGTGPNAFNPATLGRQLGKAARNLGDLSLPPQIQNLINAADAGHGNTAKADAAAYAYYEQLLKTPGLTQKQINAIYQAETPYASEVSPFGAEPPFTKNVKKAKKAAKPSLLDQVLPPAMQAELNQARANAADGSYGSLQKLLATEKQTLDYLNAEHATGKKLVELTKERAQLAKQVTSTEGKLSHIIPGKVSGSFQLLADSFTEPLRLQLVQAKAAASSADLTPVLKRMKAAAEKALKSGKLAVQGQIDAWNEIASINQQLGTGAGNVRPVSVEKLLKGVHFASLAAKKEAEQRYAGALALGGKLPTGKSALGIPLTPAGRSASAATFSGPITINVHAGREQDPKVIAARVREELDKHAARNGVQYRGRHAGR